MIFPQKISRKEKYMNLKAKLLSLFIIEYSNLLTF